MKDLVHQFTETRKDWTRSDRRAVSKHRKVKKNSKFKKKL